VAVAGLSEDYFGFPVGFYLKNRIVGCEVFDTAIVTPVNQFFLVFQPPVFSLPFSILHYRYLLSLDRLLPRLRETACSVDIRCKQEGILQFALVYDVIITYNITDVKLSSVRLTVRKG
jgi:hypothetical protein